MKARNTLKINLSHFIDGMNAFYRLREKTDYQLDQFMENAANAISNYPEFHVKLNTKTQYQQIYLMKYAEVFLRAVKKIQIVFRFIGRLPLFYQQAKKMKQAEKMKTMRPNVVIALASNRLLGSSSENIRNYLTRLLKAFSSELNVIMIDRTVELAPYLYISDPLKSSPLWRRYQECWASGVFILDVEFLLFQAIMSIFKDKSTALFHLIFKRKTSHRFKQTFASGVLAIGYHVSLRSNHLLKAFLLSSNSFSIEVLRLYLLQSVMCDSVCEVMHGIPAIFYEQYIAEILEVSEKHGYEAIKKHSSILNIPKLPMFGILAQDVKCGHESAINTYLNNYMINKKLDTTCAQAFIQAEFQQIFKDKKLDDNALVITLIGAVSTEKNYYASRAFEIECFMMRFLMKKMAELNRPYVILYAPHPANSLEKAKKCFFFQQSHIVLCPDTIYSWLISDMSVSLFSAALFEAAHFGVHAYTPVTEKDGIFPRVLLEFLPYKRECKEESGNFIESLEQFIHFYANRLPENRLLRAENRLGKCY